MNNYDIIIKPVLSEKSYDGIAAKRYAFVVRKDANKTQIKIAIESIFGVSVEKVNTVRVSGKTRRKPLPIRKHTLPLPQIAKQSNSSKV